MKKKGIIILLIFLLTLQNISFVTNIHAEVNTTSWVDWERKLNVSPQKEWTILFSPHLKVETISNESIYILDSKSEKMNVDLSIIDGKNQVVLSPPDGGYQPGEIYMLYIEPSVTNIKKKPLKDGIRMEFQISTEYSPFVEREDSPDTVTYSEEVKMIDDQIISDSIISQTAQEVTVSKNFKEITNLKEGDIFFLPSTYENPFGVAKKITQVTVNNENIVLETEDPSLDEIVKEMDISESYEVDFRNFQLNPELAKEDRFSITSKEDDSKLHPEVKIEELENNGFKLIVENLEIPNFGIGINGTIEFIEPTVNEDIILDYNLFNDKPFVDFTILEFLTTENLDLNLSIGDGRKLPLEKIELGIVPVLGAPKAGVNLVLYFVMELDGSIAVEYGFTQSSNIHVGIEKHPVTENLNLINHSTFDAKNKELSLKGSVNVKAGMETGVYLLIGNKSFADLNVQAGYQADFSGKVTSVDPLQICYKLDPKVYAAGTYNLGHEFDLGAWGQLGTKLTGDIFKKYEKPMSKVSSCGYTGVRAAQVVTELKPGESTTIELEGKLPNGSWEPIKLPNEYVKFVVHDEEALEIDGNGKATLDINSGFNRSFIFEILYNDQFLSEKYNFATIRSPQLEEPEEIIEITGVEHNKTYTVPVTPTFNIGHATLQKDEEEKIDFSSGTTIKENGHYQLSVRHNDQTVHIEFDIASHMISPEKMIDYYDEAIHKENSDKATENFYELLKPYNELRQKTMGEEWVPTELVPEVRLEILEQTSSKLKIKTIELANEAYNSGSHLTLTAIFDKGKWILDRFEVEDVMEGKPFYLTADEATKVAQSAGIEVGETQKVEKEVVVRKEIVDGKYTETKEIVDVYVFEKLNENGGFPNHKYIEVYSHDGSILPFEGEIPGNNDNEMDHLLGDWTFKVDDNLFAFEITADTGSTIKGKMNTYYNRSVDYSIVGTKQNGEAKLQILFDSQRFIDDSVSYLSSSWKQPVRDYLKANPPTVNFGFSLDDLKGKHEGRSWSIESEAGQVVLKYTDVNSHDIQLEKGLASEEPVLKLSKTEGIAGERIRVEGEGFPAGDRAYIYFDSNGNGKRELEESSTIVNVGTNGKWQNTGFWDGYITAGIVEAGEYQVRYEGINTGVKYGTPFTVKERKKLILSKTEGIAGERIRVEGEGFPAGDRAYIYFDSNGNGERDPEESSTIVDVGTNGKWQNTGFWDGYITAGIVEAGEYQVRYESHYTGVKYGTPFIVIKENN